MKKVEYAIIGAGLTGITLCKKLREKGIRDIVVFEKEQEPGGLCRTKVIDGHVLDTCGGHFFNSKYRDVLDYVFSFLPESAFNYYERVSKIKIGANTIDYPLESNIWQLPQEEGDLLSDFRDPERRIRGACRTAQL